MPAAGWMWRWRGDRGAGERASAPVLAAARGEPLGQLLHLGARALLAAAEADRAGLWLSGDRRGESGAGSVVEAEPGPIPEQWKRLDVSTPFLRAALESTDPLRVEFAAEELTPHLGPLIGMRSAIWIPLRANGRTFGLAMAAYAKPPGGVDIDALRARADEIALAVQHDRNFRHGEQAAEEQQTQLRLSRAILCGVSTDSILRQIAHAARHYTQAEFVSLGRGAEPPLIGEGWDGAPGWLGTLQQEGFSQLWRGVFEEGRESELPGGILESVTPASTDGAPAILDRVVALPIERRNGTRGVLMAGFSRAEDAEENLHRLEGYALLAATALDREAAREERMASSETLRKIIEDSGECLLVIDGDGKILEASRAAALLLFPTWGGMQDAMLEELFSPFARDGVAEWRERFLPVGPELTQGNEIRPPVFEAELERGGIVRMHLRREITGTGGAGPRWLLFFEEQANGRVEERAAQQMLRESEERLEAELGGLLESIDSGVLLLDANGRIRMASARLASIFGFESRRLQEFRTIHGLIDTVAQNFLRPAETVARWREHVARGSESSWDEIELVRPSRKSWSGLRGPFTKRAENGLAGWKCIGTSPGRG